MTLTALVADDEPIARRKLARLIASVPWLQHAGEAGDGSSAMEAISRLRPDIVFLDVRMPELSGLEVVGRIQSMTPVPVVIFTTAYDQYAVTAFELRAVDYLLKPFGAERFRVAVDRAREVIQLRGAAALAGRAQDALREVATPEARLQNILVRSAGSVVPVQLTDISRIEAQDDYVMIHTDAGRHLVSLRVNELEKRLPQPPFLRIHRSHIVNLDHVAKMEWRDDARLDVHLRDGAVVAASRARSKDVRRQAR